MKNLTIALLLAIFTFGCMSAAPQPEDVDNTFAGLVNECDPNEDVQFDADGNIVHGISQCAVCRRFEDAYNVRATELGCTTQYPLDACPIDEGMTNCLVWQVENWTSDMSWATSCEQLVTYFGQLETYGGFECGDRCWWSDPFANPTHSLVEQEDRSNTDYRTQHVCCADTPYALRSTPLGASATQCD